MSGNANLTLEFYLLRENIWTLREASRNAGNADAALYRILSESEDSRNESARMTSGQFEQLCVTIH